ncbi:type I phosphomannose isomerase catalytic subunit [Namhaeicola litoreus]|uniref:Phosphohexomutase n=1 Tax=Namhaeicola litoreus TaxID=1052145 RepID=A0ABW3Y4M4_9FLAO
MNLYPLKFDPIFQYRIWGGNKLKTFLNKNISTDHIGESWEISDVSENQTLVSNGPLKGRTIRDLINTFKGDLVGKKVYERFGTEFPLLIKFIDAKTPLSIQVHPSDELAKERHNSFGKNEMWYIMDAEKDAEIIVGFEKETNIEEYQKVLKEDKILDLLHIENPKKGDTYYIPTGRVHAIGAGILLAEIQQTSDITYRIYDYNRVDTKTGKKRQLHTSEAIDAIDFSVINSYKTSYTKKRDFKNELVNSKYFKTNFYTLTKNRSFDYTNLDSFVILICVEGTFEILELNKNIKVIAGETILIPANIAKISLLTTNTSIIEVTL